MGRKATDHVTEHRITFGDLERTQIQQVIDTQKANIAIDGVTSTLQAAGSALAGGGVLWAAVGLMAWFGGGALFEAGKQQGNKIWNGINDFVAYSIFDDFTTFVATEGQPSFDAEKWRAINKADQARMEEAQAKMNKYGHPASQYYDEQKALVAHQELLHAIDIRDTNNILELAERQIVREHYPELFFGDPTYSPNELALIAAYEEAMRAWRAGGEVGYMPTLDLSRANN